VGRAAAVRKYVAASYISLWQKTQSCLANRRHFYEIVRDSVPCHIYFDLEFATAENRDVDGNAKVDCLLNIVASLVKYVSSGQSMLHVLMLACLLTDCNRLPGCLPTKARMQSCMEYTD
jgi:hypothetical protein